MQGAGTKTGYGELLQRQHHEPDNATGAEVLTSQE